MRASVVFPHPDSPTSATTSPGRIDRSTPSTARSVRFFRKSPAETLNVRPTPRASTRGAELSAPPAGTGFMAPPPQLVAQGRRSRRRGCIARGGLGRHLPPAPPHLRGTPP